MCLVSISAVFMPLFVKLTSNSLRTPIICVLACARVRRGVERPGTGGDGVKRDAHR